MSTFELWSKMIRTQTYTKEVAIKRVNVISPLLTDDEFEKLIALIKETYK